jgi:hypothetical protein
MPNKRLAQLLFAQGAHQGAKVAHSGKHQTLGAVDVRAAVDQRHGFAQALNGVHNRADIAGAVIKESNHGFFCSEACKERRETVQGQACRRSTVDLPCPRACP